MTKQHRRFEPADKIKILREHLLDGRPLSEVCDKYSIAPPCHSRQRANPA